MEKAYSSFVKRFMASVILYLFTVGVVYPQPANNDPMERLKNVVPPSPNASSLGKYADWPVSLYTGVPDISIPIYNIKTRSLEVPITLGYHSSGNKVGEIASWVGLGWSLNAGGIITRSICGLPDDDYYDGYLINRSHYKKPGDMWSGTNPAYLDNEYTINSAKGQTDTEPDIYMFNSMGRSFKFYFTGDGTIVTQPYSQLKISCNWSDSTWKVILEDGTILNFGSTNFIETTSTSRFSRTNGGTGINLFISSWLLRSIVSSTGEVVNFSYTGYLVHQQTFNAQSDFMLNNPTINNVAVCSLQPCSDYVVPFKSRSDVQTVGSSQLNTIESELCRVEFIHEASERKDLKNGHALSQIKVFSKVSSNYIRQYNFNYDYTNAGGTDYVNFRLKLMSVKQIGSDNTIGPSWNFEYNPQKLPPRNSYAQDHFGYFNGATNNTTLLPEIITSRAYHDNGFGSDHYKTGIRSVNPSYMQAEMLTKINYPTGGFTRFEFEPNFYLSTEEAFVPGKIYHQIEDYTGVNQFVFQRTDTLRITRKQYVTIYTSAYISPSILRDHPNPNVHVQIMTLSGQTIAGAELVNNQDRTTYQFLQPGTYIYKTRVTGVFASDFEDPNDYLRLISTIYYKKGAGTQSVPKMVGGLRIKSQEISDGISATVQKIYYQYGSPLVISDFDTVNAYLSDYFDEAKVNSWKYVGGVVVYTCDNYGGDVDGSECFNQFLIRNSTTKESVGMINGGPIGYGEVKVLYGANGENGYTINRFSNENADEGIDLSKEFPYPPICSTDWRRGLLIEQATYTGSGKPIKRITNNYQFKYKNSIFGFRAGITKVRHSVLNGAVKLSDIQKRDVKVKTDAVQLVSKTEKTYDPQTGDSIETVFNYYYDNPNNLQATRIETLNSKSENLKTLLRTPLEKIDINNSTPLTVVASAALDSMAARNIISAIIQKEQYKETKLINRSLTNFKVDANNLVLPENVQVQTNSDPIETRIQFTAYDSKGNLTEQQRSKDVKHSYIYDYYTHYPIAEVINAGVDFVAYTSFESNGDGKWNIGSTARNSNGITGIKCYQISNAPISKTDLNAAAAYTISYWSTGGACAVTGNVGNPVQGKTVTINGIRWNQYMHTVTGVTTVTVSGSGLIDELRLYPKGAQMNTYAYEPLIGIISQCDLANNIVYYEYDAFGRLLRIRDADKNILKQYEYQYQTYGSNVPVWQVTGNNRCKPCAQNGNYITNVKQREEKDVNPLSNSGTRWVDIGISSDCVIQPDWQNTTAPVRCKKDASNQNTGELEREQRDVNPCSSGQTRWVVTGINTTSCPLPCTSSTCSGEGYKCVGGVCERGIRVCTASIIEITDLYLNIYHYEWSDGSWSDNYTEYSSEACW
jgi:YD repeat-containing protein